MVAQKRTIWIVLVSIMLMVFTAACSRGAQFTPQWLLIKWFDGELLPGHRSEVRVYVAHHLSGDGQAVTYLQNKFEVTTDGKPLEYLWPDDKTFAAGWCEILDLDRNGRKEFMVGSNRIIRIVSYDGHSMLFRPREDEITSINYDIGPFDLKHDVGFEFIVDDPIVSGAVNVSVPRAKAWKADAGFTDVSKQYKGYYDDIVIPDFTKHVENARSPAEREAYERGLRSVRQILGGS